MRPSLGLNMKKYIPWAIITIAFLVALYELIYGSPGRIIFYTVMLLMLWGSSWIVKKISQDEEVKK